MDSPNDDGMQASKAVPFLAKKSHLVARVRVGGLVTSVHT